MASDREFERCEPGLTADGQMGGVRRRGHEVAVTAMGASEERTESLEVVVHPEPELVSSKVSWDHHFTSATGDFVQVFKVKAFVPPLMTPMPPSREAVASQIRAAKPEAKVEASDYEDFTVEKEGWNVYKLSDGTIVKLRQLLMRLRKGLGLEPSETGLQVEFSNLLMTTYPPRNLQGQPSTEQYTIEELMGFVVERDVNYQIVQETTNEYVTASNVRLTLRLASVKIDRTSKFDIRGDPRYLANAQVDVQITPPGLAP